MGEHTPTPWATEYRKGQNSFYGQDIYEAATGETIATAAWYPVALSDTHTTTNREANAAFIVKAVNCHDDLVAALEEARSAVEYAYRGTDSGTPDERKFSHTAEVIRAALAKAEAP